MNERIEDLIVFLSLNGFKSENIRCIYVVGHAIGNVVLRYFHFLLMLHGKRLH